MTEEQNAPGHGQEGEMNAGQIRERVTSGVAAVGLRAMAVRAVGLVTNIVLARLLSPQDFGILAFGQTLVMFGSLVTDVGFGAGLMRQARAPSQAQLDALFGLQLVATTLFTAAMIAALLPLGRTGHVSAAMTGSLILASLAGPRVVVLERELNYSTIAAADIASGLVYSAIAIVLVATGAGVWGVAIAHVIRAGVQTLIIIWKTRTVRTVPRLGIAPLRGLLSFGLKFQATTLVDLARSEGLNVLILAIAGVSVLGIWSLAQRILLIPYLLFEALWRVSYPAIARMVAQGVDPGPDVERALRLASAVTVLMLVGLAASAPALVPAVFGPTWSRTAAVIPLGSLGIAIFGPISAAYGGYLYAIGRAGRVLAAIASAAICWFLLLPILLPPLGAFAFGLTWLIASIGEAAFLVGSLDRSALRASWSALGLPLSTGVLCADVGLWICSMIPHTLIDGLAIGIGATVVYLLVMLLLRRQLVLETVRLSARMLGLRSRQQVTDTLTTLGEV